MSSARDKMKFDLKIPNGIVHVEVRAERGNLYEWSCDACLDGGTVAADSLEDAYARVREIVRARLHLKYAYEEWVEYAAFWVCSHGLSYDADEPCATCDCGYAEFVEQLDTDDRRSV